MLARFLERSLIETYKEDEMRMEDGWQKDAAIQESFKTLAQFILVAGAYKATSYINEKLTVKATLKRYKWHKDKRHHKNQPYEIVFTVGPPNYEEREAIKKRKKAGETIRMVRAKFADGERKAA